MNHVAATQHSDAAEREHREVAPGRSRRVPTGTFYGGRLLRTMGLLRLHRWILLVAMGTEQVGCAGFSSTKVKRCLAHVATHVENAVNDVLDQQILRGIDAYRRAANHFSVGQIHLHARCNRAAASGPLSPLVVQSRVRERAHPASTVQWSRRTRVMHEWHRSGGRLRSPADAAVQQHGVSLRRRLTCIRRRNGRSHVWQRIRDRFVDPGLDSLTDRNRRARGQVRFN